MLTACQAKKDLAARLGRLGIAYEKLTARTIGFGDLARSRDSAPTANVAPLFVKVVGLKRFPIPDWVTLKKEAAAVGYCIETPLELQGDDLMDNQFKTTCPHCGEGGELFVTKVTLIQSGNILPMYVPLQGDGFVFDPNDINIRDWSTTDEEVTCRACGTKMPLSELTN